MTERPEGSLTPAQFEILQLLWEAERGLSAAEIWEAIRENRDVSRTTISNLVDRLENETGWSATKRKGFSVTSPASRARRPKANWRQSSWGTSSMVRLPISC